MAQSVVSLFVENIPEAMHWKRLWFSFARHGEVENVYIARKRSREILTDKCGNREEESNQKVIDVGHVENVAGFIFEGSQRDVSDEIVEKLDARAGEFEIGPFGVSSQLSEHVAKNMDKNECIVGDKDKAQDLKSWANMLNESLNSVGHIPKTGTAMAASPACVRLFQQFMVPGLERSWNAILQFASYRIEEKGNVSALIREQFWLFCSRIGCNAMGFIKILAEFDNLSSECKLIHFRFIARAENKMAASLAIDDFSGLF
ncbi:hypothetical protein V6N11_044783 [Hibiscus sabdariffa]|uniref:Uncharacterized protein n=1 Tax=Hibiscus sabdariffa TaxID=183260 RepID=A0ABR2PTY3_9ROSI